MKIDSYSFGQIVIEGKKYTADVIVYDNRVDSSWWRKEGHELYPEDITEALKDKPDILIIGTGNVGMMKVPKKTAEYIASRGVDVKVERTGKAVDLFNQLQGKKSVIAALHLTC